MGSALGQPPLTFEQAIAGSRRDEERFKCVVPRHPGVLAGPARPAVLTRDPVGLGRGASCARELCCVAICIRHDAVPLGREGEALAQIIQAWADEGRAVQEPTASVIEGHPVELPDEERVLGLQLNGLAHRRSAEASSVRPLLRQLGLSVRA